MGWLKERWKRMKWMLEAEEYPTEEKGGRKKKGQRGHQGGTVFSML